MSKRRATRARRAAAAAALVAVFALVAAGCGSGDDKSGGGSSQQSSASSTASSRPAADSTKVIGEMKGPNGIVVTLHSAVRDSGGFVTVSGTLTNHGTQMFNAVDWRSQETEMKSLSSVSGASLVDETGKKRYLVLRDTDGQCLCTTGLSGIEPNQSRPIFAQFPAPPKNVTRVDFQIPTMPSVSIELTG
jgi:hypothetical protein